MATNFQQSNDFIHPLAFVFIDKCKSVGVTLNSDEINAIDFLTRQLVQNDLWDKFKAIYPFVGRSGSSHGLNLKNVERHRIVWYNFNDLTFNEKGVTNKNKGYGNTVVAPSWFDDNDIHLSIYYSDFWQNLKEFSPIIGSRSKNDGKFMHTITLRSSEPVLNSNGNFSTPPTFTYSCGYASNSDIRFAGSDASQFQHVESHGFIVGVNGIKCYVNGKIFGREGDLSNVPSEPINAGSQTNRFGNNVVIPNISQFPFLLFTNEAFGSSTTTGRANANIRFASIGYALSDIENEKLYNIVQSFQEILGRSVEPVKLKSFEKLFEDKITINLQLKKIITKISRNRREYLSKEKQPGQNTKIISLSPNLEIKKITVFGPVRVFCTDSSNLSVSVQSFVEI